MAEHLSKHERRLLRHKEKDADNKQEISAKKKPFNKKLLIWVIVGIAIFGAGYIYYAYSNSPGPYDDFAKCLTEKGAVMYGAIEWCKYTKAQAAMFGKSFKYINYKNYKEGQNIKITPTWIMNNEIYEGLQSFDRLSAISGCKA
ncbi:MAG: hypothetical protein AB1571_00440 [Nanoarchaeota archaeon]